MVSPSYLLKHHLYSHPCFWNRIRFCHIIPSPYEGGKQDATLSFKDEDFVKIALGKMNPQIASLRNSRRNAAHLQRHRNQFLVTSVKLYSAVYCFFSLPPLFAVPS
ncbi:hypothetical protein IC582_019667 [Cucumis melo]|uniref:Uncharacterized protein LOC103486063 isoform X2 n=1 Tax=Cucumis melo TaxID=3656 RepID=A0A1S3B4H6_CUCME|nr:uncharacterized protein LOC103486063 isoform X2 [Cucumis melo]XP_008442103.1 uncharacterized protein LOC103486063 isoform X2 [Cucumis melo]XP_016899557.1 uncharacterized protein LOC103486063 isoform X2 [Cucumis melo]XP_050944426.1 uncharacterized protein LOC103486063 isoform X2 [Cucumis melo]XP_050944428.1 uncharacterized protein LOC103486063 isoform X2 [Cucumis melo]